MEEIENSVGIKWNYFRSVANNTMSSELLSYELLQTGLTHFATLGLAVWAAVYHRYIYAFFRTLPRDAKALVRIIKVFRDLHFVQKGNVTVAQLFDECVRQNPEKVILYFEDEKWTSLQVQRLANQIANYFQEQGFKKGDSVALLMENRPEYLCIWLGLSKIGVVAALTNYNLRLQPLRHCFEAVNCKAIIYNDELSSALEEVIGIGGLAGTSLYSLCSGDSSPSLANAIHLTKALENVPSTQPNILTKVTFQDKLFYIYTSGTTGLPKAAIIKHSRYMMAAVGNFHMHGLSRDDIIYTALPLYHGAGNMLGGGVALCYGAPMVIRKKFSASNFWKDCIRYNVTAAQYIGEICRYLMAQPPSPADKAHKVRIMFGNGLRKEIWPDFVKRFNIPQINELYGATEGNCNMVNIDNKVGAVGFLPWHLSWLIPYQLIKVDEETGEPIRDKYGRLITCNPDEPGELIGRIQRNHPIRDYLGYADKNSSKGKVLENAFKKGDAWFRSGDILVRDICGYFYFLDRRGDTFRWKGENCSTAEVESVISGVCGLKDVVVYGVEVPGTEGRAGMAVVADPDESLDLDVLAQGISKALPSYARPLFVRTLQKIEKTGTYKLQKLVYQKQGFDVTKFQDKVFFLQGSRYVRLTNELYGDILSGKIKM